MAQLKIYTAMLLPFVLLLGPALAPAAELGERQAITALLAKAKRALAEDRLTVPSGDNAVAYAQELLDLAPEHPAAQRILRDVVSRYGAIAESALDRVETVKQQELAKANTFRARAERVAQRHGLPDERLRRMDERIAALDPGSLQGPIREHPLARKVVSQLIERYADKAEIALGMGDVAGAQRYHGIARDLASDYRVAGEALADLEGRIQAAERGGAAIAQVDAQKPPPADGPAVTPQEFKAVFLPPAF